MGKELRTNDEADSGQSVFPAAEGKGEGGQGASGNDNGTESQGTAPRRRTGGQGTSEGIRIIGEGNEEGEIFPSLAVGIKAGSVDNKKPSAMIPDFAQPAKKGTPKKAGPKKTAKADSDRSHTEGTAKMISELLVVVSGITSMRAGEHWALQKEECDAIAAPVSNILAKYDLTEKASQYGDWAALITALAMTLVPRVIMTQEMNKKKVPRLVKGEKANEKPVQQTAIKRSNPENAHASTSGRDGQQLDGGHAAYGISPLKQLLTPIMG